MKWNICKCKYKLNKNINASQILLNEIVTIASLLLICQVFKRVTFSSPSVENIDLSETR